MSRRREARERVLQALYAGELSGSDIDHLIRTLIRPELGDDDVTYKFAVSLLARTMEREDVTRALIGEHTKNWHIKRIAIIDRLLLQMAVTEILYFEDIPPKVSINEVIEIAKRFSTARSGQFINGILDAILDDLRRQGKVHKTGRGLVGMDDAPEASLTTEPSRPIAE